KKKINTSYFLSHKENEMNEYEKKMQRKSEDGNKKTKSIKELLSLKGFFEKKELE
ncbi:hypothetical protein WUBG_11994, partial [Wuchereria bancrofti]